MSLPLESKESQESRTLKDIRGLFLSFPMCFPAFQDRLDINTSVIFLLNFIIHSAITVFNSDLVNHEMMILPMSAFHRSKRTPLEVLPGFTLRVFPHVTQGSDSFGKAPQILQDWGSSSTGVWESLETASEEHSLTLESRNEKTEVAEFIL